MRVLIALLITAALAPGAFAQGVARETVPGITNFARVEMTVACAGAATPDAMAEVKRMGFASVINLRQATENGANVEAEQKAAIDAGLRYVHLPLSGTAPDDTVVDRFLTIVADEANRPAFIHCASGNRAAALWLVKRVRLDGWPYEKAAEEARALGLTSAALEKYAAGYLARKRS
jgi:uncharacterized protein (TIGR01244 family)